LLIDFDSEKENFLVLKLIYATNVTLTQKKNWCFKWIHQIVYDFFSQFSNFQSIIILTIKHFQKFNIIINPFVKCFLIFNYCHNSQVLRHQKDFGLSIKSWPEIQKCQINSKFMNQSYDGFSVTVAYFELIVS
jgi:hypothetical protein